MKAQMSVEAAARDLPGLLRRMHAGETVKLLDTDGEPLAALVSLRARRRKPLPAEEWDARWSALAKRVSAAWQGDASAVETLSEMRR
ncbi:MAG TPA: hypothetical protein VNE39_27525 [Planctomycetota bacterium]|nr:hypothetical protein [Planctomycetota bacterium]